MSYVTMVTSGKGGVGKSGCCVMLGSALSRLGKKVLVIELDSGLRSLDIMMGLDDRVIYDICDVLDGNCEPIKAIYKYDHAPSLYLMPATSRISPYIKAEDISRLCKGLAGYFDYVLLDTPAGIGSAFDAAANAADSAIIVVTPDAVSVRDGALVSRLLYSQGIENMRLIINKVRTDTVKSGMVENLDKVIDDVAVQLIGVVPDDAEFLKAMAKGRALSEKNTVYMVYDRIARRLCSEYVPLLIC